MALINSTFNQDIENEETQWPAAPLEPSATLPKAKEVSKSGNDKSKRKRNRSENCENPASDCDATTSKFLVEDRFEKRRKVAPKIHDNENLSVYLKTNVSENQYASVIKLSHCATFFLIGKTKHFHHRVITHCSTLARHTFAEVMLDKVRFEDEEDKKVKLFVLSIMEKLREAVQQFKKTKKRSYHSCDI